MKFQHPTKVESFFVFYRQLPELVIQCEQWSRMVCLVNTKMPYLKQSEHNQQTHISLYERCYTEYTENYFFL